MPWFKKFPDSPIYEEVFPSKRLKTIFGKISTYACIQWPKFRMQALFLMEISINLSDCRRFDLLLFLGLKSEFNHYSPGLQLVSQNLNSFSKLKKYSKLERWSEDDPSVPICWWRKRYFDKTLFENTNFSTYKKSERFKIKKTRWRKWCGFSRWRKSDLPSPTPAGAPVTNIDVARLSFDF